jgi:hypothetical protein
MDRLAAVAEIEIQPEVLQCKLRPRSPRTISALSFCLLEIAHFMNPCGLIFNPYTIPFRCATNVRLQGALQVSQDHSASIDGICPNWLSYAVI